MSCRSKMPTIGRNTAGLAAAMALAAACGGCDGDASDDFMSTRPAEPTRGVYGTLLHEEVVGEQHTIEFFDVGFGVGLVREMMPAGQRSVLDNIDEGDRSLATYFRLVRPTAAVPANLLDADERALVTKAKLESPRCPESVRRYACGNPRAHRGRGPEHRAGAVGADHELQRRHVRRRVGGAMVQGQLLRVERCDVQRWNVHDQGLRHELELEDGRHRQRLHLEADGG